MTVKHFPFGAFGVGVGEGILRSYFQVLNFILLPLYGRTVIFTIARIETS